MSTKCTPILSKVTMDYQITNSEPFYSVGQAREYSWEPGEPARYKQLQTQLGSDWYYNNCEELITCTNRLGYRSTTVVPPTVGDYFIMCGCSNVFGQYLHEQHRASNRVEQATGVPVINLGILGGGANMVAMNMQKLWFSNYQKPRAIIVQWPAIHRMAFPSEDVECRLVHIDIARENSGGVQETHASEYLLRHEGVYENQAHHAFHMVNSLGVPVINFAILEDIAEFYDIPRVRFVSAQDDRARDNLHGGRLMNKQIYKHIMKELNTV